MKNNRMPSLPKGECESIQPKRSDALSSYIQVLSLALAKACWSVFYDFISSRTHGEHFLRLTPALMKSHDAFA